MAAQQTSVQIKLKLGNTERNMMMEYGVPCVPTFSTIPGFTYLRTPTLKWNYEVRFTPLESDGFSKKRRKKEKKTTQHRTNTPPGYEVKLHPAP
jgi:hypothetical protein